MSTLSQELQRAVASGCHDPKSTCCRPEEPEREVGDAGGPPDGVNGQLRDLLVAEGLRAAKLDLTAARCRGLNAGCGHIPDRDRVDAVVTIADEVHTAACCHVQERKHVGEEAGRAHDRVLDLAGGERLYAALLGVDQPHRAHAGAVEHGDVGEMLHAAAFGLP